MQPMDLPTNKPIETMPESGDLSTRTELERTNPPTINPTTPMSDDTSHNNIINVFDDVAAADDSAAVATPATATPPPAADGDLIEKVWVEQTDKIIAENQNDPHAEEEAAEVLSQSYLKQRFGIDVDKPSSG